MRDKHLIFTGSWTLCLRGLLSRTPHDLDFIYNPYSHKLHKFIKQFVHNIDWSRNRTLTQYELFWYKNRYIKISVIHEVLLAKYFKHKEVMINSHVTGIKHTIDLINVFHNLGKKRSLEEIHKMDVSLEDRVELILLMQKGLNNKYEILF